MNDDVMDSIDPGHLEMRRRLEAFADLRLTPSVAATTRMRTGVMNAAHRWAALVEVHALVEADATLDPSSRILPALAGWRTRPTLARWRRPATALLAASLTLGTLAGVASAAKPGGPLYAARLWSEMATLPADPIAHADAEVGRLEERLHEVQQASRDGDGSAAQAALAAYSAIMDEAERASAADPAAGATIEATVSRHVAVLIALVDSVPQAARAAVESALASSTRYLDDFRSTGGNGGNGDHRGQPGLPGNNGQPQKPGNNGQPQKPAVTPEPARPDKSPNPASPGNGGGQSGTDGPHNDQ